jgi:hypothetical protein
VAAVVGVKSDVVDKAMLAIALGGALFACSSDAPGGSREVAVAGGTAVDPNGAGSTAAGSSGDSTGLRDTNSTTPVTEQPTMPVAGSEAGSVKIDAGTEVCVQDSAETTLTLKPIDIIFTVDTSGSMDQEIAGVQSNINQNFAKVIGDSGIDYRVILISNDEVCVQGMLNPSGCGGHTPPTFYWVDYQIGSHDTWCAILDTYPYWGYLLRADAFKVFVTITDDNPNCLSGGTLYLPNAASASSFDAALMALDPVQFGSASDRHYTYHSLVALAENTPATAAYAPTDPLVTAECPTAASNGLGYQELSQMTEGLRFPVCEGNNFDAVFQEIAKGIVDSSAVACEFVIPEMSPDGKEIVRDTVEVAYVKGDGSATVKFAHVTSEAECATEAFFIDGDIVRLCPSACDAIKQDPMAQVQVLFGCSVCGGLDVDCGTAPPPDLPPLE